MGEPRQMQDINADSLKRAMHKGIHPKPLYL